MAQKKGKYGYNIYKYFNETKAETATRLICESLNQPKYCLNVIKPENEETSKVVRTAIINNMYRKLHHLCTISDVKMNLPVLLQDLYKKQWLKTRIVLLLFQWIDNIQQKKNMDYIRLYVLNNVCQIQKFYDKPKLNVSIKRTAKKVLKEHMDNAIKQIRKCQKTEKYGILWARSLVYYEQSRFTRLPTKEDKHIISCQEQMYKSALLGEYSNLIRNNNVLLYNKTTNIVREYIVSQIKKKIKFVINNQDSSEDSDQADQVKV